MSCFVFFSTVVCFYWCQPFTLDICLFQILLFYMFWLVPLWIFRDLVSAPCHCFKNWFCLSLFLRWPFYVSVVCLWYVIKNVLFFVIQNQISLVQFYVKSHECVSLKDKKEIQLQKYYLFTCIVFASNTVILQCIHLHHFFFSVILVMSAFGFKCQGNGLIDHCWKIYH